MQFLSLSYELGSTSAEFLYAISKVGLSFLTLIRRLKTSEESLDPILAAPQVRTIG